MTTTFLVYCFGTAMAQAAATALLVKLFQRRNFAIGIIYSKSEAFIIALLGTIIYSQELSGFGWLSVLCGMFGITLLNQKAEQERGVRFLFSASAGYGIASGFCFTLTALWAREASLNLHANAIISSALTLAVSISIQFMVLTCVICFKEPEALTTLRKEWKLGGAVGVLSLLGSIGWFTAFSLQSPALVKTLGQVEFFFALILSARLFKERHSLWEYLGIAMILVSIILLLWVG